MTIPSSRAAIAHAQFETIHPYGDGNGRIGRLVVLWVLARGLGVRRPPPVSALIARDVGGYLAGLHEFRSGDVGPWVRWFADVVERAASAGAAWVVEADGVVARWRQRTSDLRADSATRRIVDLLPAHIVISASLAAAELGVSDTAARSALAVLADRGVVAELPLRAPARGRPRHWWVATEIADLVASWTG